MTFAMVFPGQGSQSVGMLTALSESETAVLDTFSEASEVLGYDLWQVVEKGPEEQLNSTDVTQPALLTAGVSVFRAWQGAGGKEPRLMSGHSLGEYTALVCAGAMEFRDAVDLVRHRGQLMQQAVSPGEGAMAAILGLEDDQVAEACAGAAGDEVVSAVNFNSPGQVVIAGNAEAVARAIELAKGLGARRALALPVSVPSHCSLMKEAADKLSDRLAEIEIKGPAIPVVHNVDASRHPAPDDIRRALTQQLHQPVRWTDCVLAMQSEGVAQLVEAGPGKVLAGLTRRIDRSIGALPVFDPDSLATALAAV